MRVIAGSARSIKLDVPEGKDVRPTIDRFKETVFNIIQSRVPGCRFLDVFAGSGAMGIEALSRGAESATFIENSNNTMKCIEGNLKRTKLFEKGILLKYDYGKALMLEGEKGKAYDIIFMDPPYNMGMEKHAAELIASSGLMADDGMLIVESAVHTNMDFLEAFGFSIIREKKFKTSQFTFAEKNS